jgi:hypothetical protein
LQISSDGINKYTLANSGEIDISASNVNVNGNAMQIVGTGGGGTAFFASDIRCTQSDLGFSDQVLTRAQNDARYLPSATTTLSTIPAPTASVDFSGQLLRNLQTPVLGTDAASKSSVDSQISTALVPYSTSSQIASTYLTQGNAASTYITPAATDTKISTALVPYSTSSQIASTYITQANASSTYITPSQTDTKISTALVPYSTSSQIASTYLTQGNAANTYQPQITPFTKIANGNNTIEAQTSNGGHKIFAGLSGAKQEILGVFAPSG